MTDWVTAHFGSGLTAARRMRQELLSRLDAEPEWTIGWENDMTVTWLSGPLASSFSVRPSGTLTPGLAVLSVRTRCAWVSDVALAECAVADLNIHTTVNRWMVVNAPGPDGWFDDTAAGPQLSGMSARRSRHLLAPPDPDATPSVEVGFSVVVGDPETELPVAALVLAVGEQISQATSLITNDWAAAFGDHAAVTLNDRARSSDEWSEVVFHYDTHVLPHSTEDAAPLMAAVVGAFTAEQQGQFDAGVDAWFGSGDETGFTCEVPYGPGPYPMGVIGRGGTPHLDDESNETSLVQGFLVANPHIGNGLLLTLRTGGYRADDDGDEWAAVLLNAQDRENGFGGGDGCAHGWGAWVVNDGEVQHALFIPSAWAVHLTVAELRVMFRATLANAARLSWLSRRVLEPLCDLEFDVFAETGDLPPSGLAAGSSARGPQFGELGAGVDPGARMLGHNWNDLVGGDADWADLTTGEETGFDFWPNEHRQQFRSTPCGCDYTGALVTVDTALFQTHSTRVVEQLLQYQDAGLTGAVVTPDNGTTFFLQAIFHVHDDSLRWLKGWAPAIAVAQALLAEQLTAFGAESVTLVWAQHPELGVRPHRDQMLELFDQGHEWITNANNHLESESLALALAFDATMPYAAEWDGAGVLINWLTSTVLSEGDQFESAFATRYSKALHPLLGECLRITTRLEITNDLVEWCLSANNWIASGQNYSTVIGGFGLNPTGNVVFCTLIPTAVDRSRNLDGHASFIGTSISHHRSIIDAAQAALDEFPAVRISVWAVQVGLSGLPAFYRAAGQLLPPDVSVTVEAHGTGFGSLEVAVTRSWPTEGDVREWPRLGEYRETLTPHVLTSVPISASELPITALRLVHGAILGALEVGELGEENRVPLGTLSALRLNPSSVNDVLGELIGQNVIVLDDDNQLMVPTGIQGLQATLVIDVAQEHPVWGPTMTVSATIPGTVRPSPVDAMIEDSRWILGDWYITGSESVFRVCVPPAVMAVGMLAARQDVLKTVLLALATACRHARAA
jgi:hypothetical protein